MLARFVTAGLAAGAILFCGDGALAKPKHCPPGHAKKGWCDPGQFQSRRGTPYDDHYDRRRGSRVEYYERRITPFRASRRDVCQDLRQACLYKDQLGERGRGNCREYRETCR